MPLRRSGARPLRQNEFGFTIFIMQTDDKRGGARPGAGRPALPTGEAMVPVMIKMKPAQKDKLQRLGGPAWVRDRIDKAKEPTAKE